MNDILKSGTAARKPNQSALLQKRKVPNTPLLNANLYDILSDLVAMQTITGNLEANHEALDYIEQLLSPLNLHIKRLLWNGVESLVATTRPTLKPEVCLLGHIDVVPGTREQFILRQNDKKLFGRGVLDMKGAIAAFIGAAYSLGSKLYDYDFGIIIVSDEETGGSNGAAKLVEAGYHPKAIILPDGGDANWGVEKIAKGMWHVDISAQGLSAHGSRPWEGDNAVDKIIDIIIDVRKLFPNPGPEQNTLNVGVIHGGQATNQIPAEANVSLDMRFMDSDSQKTIMDAVASITQAYGATLSTISHGDVVLSEPSNPYIAAYAKQTKSVIGKVPNWVISKAANDGRWFVPYGSTCIVAYPKGGGHHGPDEWLSVNSLESMQQLFIRYLEDVAYRPLKGTRDTLSQAALIS